MNRLLLQILTRLDNQFEIQNEWNEVKPGYRTMLNYAYFSKLKYFWAFYIVTEYVGLRLKENTLAKGPDTHTITHVQRTYSALISHKQSYEGNKVEDVGPTSYKYHTNVLYLLGRPHTT